MVRTALRPRGATLHATLAALEGAGLVAWAGPRLIYADGYTPTDVPGWEVEATEAPEGSAKALLGVLALAVRRWPDLTKLTLLEDDILPVRNALPYIQRFAIAEEHAFVSWFSAWPLVRSSARIRPVPTFAFLGTQAFTLPRRTVDAMLALDFSDWPHLHKGDRLFSRLAGAWYAQHTPHLFDHVAGLNSACGWSHLGQRTSFAFPGADFDALTLEKQP